MERYTRGAFAEIFLREPGRTLIPLELLTRKTYMHALYEHEPLTIEERRNTSLDENWFWDLAKPYKAGL